MLEQRVELNALTSGQLVAFIERKLAEHGISKVIPPTDLLGDAYRLSVQNARLEKIVEEAINDLDNEGDLDAPVDLGERVAKYLEGHPESRWDEEVAAIAEEDNPDDGEGG